MKICFTCDLHLPEFKNTTQYDVLNWMIQDIKNNIPDCVIFAGDVTCDGNLEVYKYFIEKMKSTDISFIYIPGNSDLRCKNTSDIIKNYSSAVVNEFEETVIIAVNDCDRTVSDDMLNVLYSVRESDIVFMHHPIEVLKEESRLKMLEWRKSHKSTKLFYAHRHVFAVNENDISLPALDPDKSIGESAAILFYDTETKNISRSNFPVTIPTDINDYFGISCYRPVKDIEFAIKNNLKNLELRPNCLETDLDELSLMINNWRKNGGENLSLHLPDVSFKENKVVLSDKFDKYIEIINLLKVDRITQHVPKVSLKTVREDKDVLLKIADELSSGLNSVKHDLVIGIENMHMTSKESADDNRRFGYIPEECLEFMEILSKKCIHKVGINFDIGHARNNAPYSQKYQISSWFTLVGKHIIGYHLHQVTNENGKFENHTAITEIYGKLISFGSFFSCFNNGSINKAPCIFEMRPENAYETTLLTFKSNV